MPASVLAAALAVLALLLAVAVGGRAAGRACYRIDRDAYHRAQAEWAAHRHAHLPYRLTQERST